MKKLFAAVALCLLLGIATLPAHALTPTYTVTGAYKKSVYYENINRITKTGDPALDAVAAALSQLDYHEGNSTAQLDGSNKSGSGNYTEYNRALGSINATYSYAWCAAFASWCLDVAGAQESAGGKFASCTLWVDKLRELGLYSSRASGYTPKTGDLIFFRSAGVSRASDHVGLVRYVRGGRVYTVEGNSSNKVSLRDYALTDTYIVGYGKPKYGGIAAELSLTAAEDRVVGLYTVTYDFVNLRAGRSATSAKRGSLSRGALVEVTEIKDGWGKIEYKGKPAYVSLDYLDFTTPVFHTVSYDLGGIGENCPAAYSYLSHKSATVSEAQPIAEGYLFLGWQTPTGERVAAGDVLPQGSLQLTALWEEIPVVEEPPAEQPPTPEAVPPLDALPDTPAPPTQTPEELPTLTPDQAPPAAAVAAGAVSGALAATLGALWCYRKRQSD